MRLSLPLTLAAFATLSGCTCGGDKPKEAVPAPSAAPAAQVVPTPDEDGPRRPPPGHPGGPGGTGGHSPQKLEQSAVRYYAMLLANKANPELSPEIRKSFEQGQPTARADVVSRCQAAGRDANACEAFAREVEAEPSKFVKWASPGLAE